MVKAIGLIIKAFIDVFYLPFRIPFMFDSDVYSSITKGNFLMIRRKDVNRLVDRNDDEIYIKYMNKHSITFGYLWWLLIGGTSNIYYISRCFFFLLTGSIIWGYLVCSIILFIRANILAAKKEKNKD